MLSPARRMRYCGKILLLVYIIFLSHFLQLSSAFHVIQAIFWAPHLFSYDAQVLCTGLAGWTPRLVFLPTFPCRCRIVEFGFAVIICRYTLLLTNCSRLVYSQHFWRGDTKASRLFSVQVTGRLGLVYSGKHKIVAGGSAHLSTANFTRWYL